MDNIKVKVEICCGTACYLLGAARILELAESLPEDLVGKVEIEAKACLGLCNDDSLGGAPYVRFNGDEVMSHATPELVVDRLRQLVGSEEQS